MRSEKQEARGKRQEARGEMPRCVVASTQAVAAWIDYSERCLGEISRIALFFNLGMTVAPSEELGRRDADIKVKIRVRPIPP
jgi:hypothetical protein